MLEVNTRIRIVYLERRLTWSLNNFFPTIYIQCHQHKTVQTKDINDYDEYIQTIALSQ